MKRNLLKTMLVGIGLLAGMGSYATVTSTIYSQNFDGLSGVPTDWTQASGALSLETDGTNKYLKESTSGSGSRGAWYKGTDLSSAVNDLDNWTLSFDCLIAEGTNTSNYSQGVWVLGTTLKQSYGVPTSPMVGIKKGSNESVYTVYVNAAATETTVNLTSNTWYHYVVAYNLSTKKLTFSISSQDGNTTVLDATEFDYDYSTATSIGNLNSIAFQAGRNKTNAVGTSNGFTCLDNITITTESDEEIVTPPTANISKIDGSSRYVTITAAEDTHTIYYYIGDDSSSPTEYTESIKITESSTLHYYAQSASGAKSEVKDLEISCVDVTLTAPTIMRTGANSYKLTATQTATDGITPTATVHYTIGGGTEQTTTSGSTIDDIAGDIVAWAEADGYTKSESTSMAYVAAISSTDVWSYDMNSFPSTYSVTAIANAIDASTETTLNNLTVYNLANIEKPNLYVENSDGWLLRNQASNAFKVQYSAASIVINNVSTNNLIQVNASQDYNKVAISSVTNGTIVYSYSNTQYFIVPSSEGAVTVTFVIGTSLNEITVGTKTESITVSSAGLATYCSSNALDFSSSSIKAYTASVSDGVATLTQIDQVPANTGVLLYAKGGATDAIPVITSATEVTGNAFVGVTEDTEITSSDAATNYVLTSVNGVVGFYKVSTTDAVTVTANKAYLSVPGSVSAKQITFAFDGETTGINNVKAINTTSNTVYNLNGQRIAQPQKGLYIVNGKKVIMK